MSVNDEDLFLSFYHRQKEYLLSRFKIDLQAYQNCGRKFRNQFIVLMVARIKPFARALVGATHNS